MHLLAFFVHPFRKGEAVGGAHRRFLEVCKGLSHKGDDIVVIERLPSLASWLSVAYSSVPVKAGVRGLPRLISLIRLGLKLVRETKADLVYVPVPMRLVENLIPAFAVARLKRIPLVLVFHHFAPENLCSYRTLWRMRRWQGLSVLAALRSVLEEAAVRFVYRHADLAVAVSRSTAQQASQHFATRRIVVNGNGVDLKAFRPVAPGSKEYDAAFLGRLHPDKGIETILRAWQIVLSKLPDARLVLIGGNRPVDVERYSNYLSNPELAGHIILTGYLEDEQVARYLARSRLFVYPSVREGFGMAVAEAMACGLPCIVSDIPALRENYQGTATFVPPENPQALAMAMIELLTNETKRLTIADLSREFASRFAWEGVCERERKILGSLVSPHLLYKNR